MLPEQDQFFYKIRKRRHEIHVQTLFDLFFITTLYIFNIYHFCVMLGDSYRHVLYPHVQQKAWSEGLLQRCS